MCRFPLLFLAFFFLPSYGLPSKCEKTNVQNAPECFSEAVLKNLLAVTCDGELEAVRLVPCPKEGYNGWSFVCCGHLIANRELKGLEMAKETKKDLEKKLSLMPAQERKVDTNTTRNDLLTQEMARLTPEINKIATQKSGILVDLLHAYFNDQPTESIKKRLDVMRLENIHSVLADKHKDLFKKYPELKIETLQKIGLLSYSEFSNEIERKLAQTEDKETLKKISSLNSKIMIRVFEEMMFIEQVNEDAEQERRVMTGNDH
ncbi:hypothetical protein L596_026263 [Steinernema carpocapsae]|uniref:E1 domain-containing protein n=1 Tax=Steinernema carpocapsae TaxID=34508 RepID=A0A4U5M0U0_STECR|nr:hypothetical protein L596_026263 [Steinernema carpocapsae]